jgi:23S rRNA (cytidine1920-2'-O)/16S rRNA (cytidine1409-2'-O)-methyltransferase
VAAGLAETRSRAQALIMAGEVLVDNMPVTKAGAPIAPEAAIRLRSAPRRFVSRGGEKLAGALEAFGVNPSGLRCLDVGASTGGFTDCLLQRGARRVVAVDVGYGQLHPALRGDPRVRVLERTNARHLDPGSLGEPFDLVVVDVSFISLRLVLPALATCAPGADMVALVKPQFEVGRREVGKRGVVREDALRTRAADEVARCAVALGWAEVGRVDSSLAGPKGNRELFLYLKAPTQKPDSGDGGAEIAAPRPAS